MFQSDKNSNDVNLDTIPRRNPKVDMNQVKKGERGSARSQIVWSKF